MFHILTPLKRVQNLRSLIGMLQYQEGIVWHILMDWDMGFRIEFPQRWIHTYYVQQHHEKFWERCNFAINWFLDNHTIFTEDYYCILNDDDGYPPNFFTQLRKADGDVLITSMKRGDATPAGVQPERAHGFDTLIAKEEHMKPGYVGVEQIFMKGKVIKDVRLPLTIAGDGEMIQWVCQHHKPTFVPDLFVWFNYLEPGRWTPTSSTPQ